MNICSVLEKKAIITTSFKGTFFLLKNEGKTTPTPYITCITEVFQSFKEEKKILGSF